MTSADIDQPAALPLRVSFIGTDTILALGARYPNSLVIEIANVSIGDDVRLPASASNAPARIVLSAESQPTEQRRSWALGTASEVASLTASIQGDGWRTTANEQGPRPQWVFTATADVVLAPGDALTLQLDGVVSSLPPGTANLYVEVQNAVGFPDARYTLSARKTDQCIAGLPLTGGGTVSWEGPGGRLHWSGRFLAVAPSGPSSFGLGYVEVRMPVRDLPAEHVHNGAPRPVSNAGIMLNGWEGLYAVHDTGRGSTELSYRIVDHTASFRTAGNWLLIAAVTGDDGTVRLGTGVTLGARTSSSGGSAIPLGTIILWSGAIESIPGGWALCDGTKGTPDLRNRFVVGAGAAYAVGSTGGSDSVTLTVEQMPSHGHGAGSSADGDHFHWTEGTSADGLSKRGRFAWGDTTVDMDYGGGWNGDPNDERWRGRVNTDNQGTHAHSISIAATGGSQPHENRPLYFALAYLMRIREGAS